MTLKHTSNNTRRIHCIAMVFPMRAATRFAFACLAAAMVTAGAFAQDTQRQRNEAPTAGQLRRAQVENRVRATLESQPGTAQIMFPFSTTPETVRYRVSNGLAIMEGDIILGRVNAAGRLLPLPPLEDRRAHTSLGYGTTSSSLTATAGNYWRWRDGRVPYEISSSFPQEVRDDILAAIADIDTNTNLTFVERRGESDFIRFETTDDDAICGQSPIGMQDGGQTIQINIDPNLGCGKEEFTHEIMHSLGAFHEQSRADRDRYIEVLWDNVLEDHEDQLESHASNGVDIGPYDFGSIMHYPRRAFGKTGENGAMETMRPLDPNAPYDFRGRTCLLNASSATSATIMGRARCLSFYDISALNALYPFVAGFTGGENWGQEYFATRIAFGDIDGDGRDEIAVSRNADQNARVFVYDDAQAGYAELWSFGAEWGSGNFATSVAFGNVDADAAEELGVTRRADSGVRAWVVHVGNNGAFTPTALGNSAQWGSGNFATDIAFGDVDADGRDEIAVTRRASSNERFFLYDDALASYVQLGGGGQNWGGDVSATAADFGDVDGDGREELAIGRRANEHGRYFIYGYTAATGLRQWATGGDAWGANAYVTDLAFGQFDADPAKELGVVRNTDENDRYFVFDDANANYRQLLAGGAGWGRGNYATGIAFGDVDRDGRDEIAIARYARGRERFWVIDDATGSFIELYAGGNRWGSDTYATSVALGDVSGDGCADFGLTRNARANMRFDVVITGACAGRPAVTIPIRPTRPVLRGTRQRQ